jgi:hypothetical protein
MIFFEQRKCFMKVKMQVIQRNQKKQNELRKNFLESLSEFRKKIKSHSSCKINEMHLPLRKVLQKRFEKSSKRVKEEKI